MSQTAAHWAMLGLVTLALTTGILAELVSGRMSRALAAVTALAAAALTGLFLVSLALLPH